MVSPPNYKQPKLDVNSAAKMSNESYVRIFDMHARTFKEVAGLDGFVDRTMLIKELLKKRPSHVMMFAPSKFGKTINMDMIRLFCDIEDKSRKTKEDVAKEPTIQELRSNPSENMKVFLRQFENKHYDECLILKQERFVVEHFGRHPVIHLNFKDCSAQNESEAIFHCAKFVKNSYLENCYLENSKEFKSGSQVDLKQKCIDWCSYNEDKLKVLEIADVIKGLKDLVKSLMIHWERDPVLLVDEIDGPCAAALQKASESEINEVQTVFTEVLGPLLKPGKSTLTFQAILVTGICRFGRAERSPTDNTLGVYFLTDPRFSKYYGLTDKEISCLVEKFFSSDGTAEVEKIINNIKRYYNGYYQLRGGNEMPTKYARYCIFSVLSYLNESKTKKKGKIFWSDRDFKKQLPLLLKKSCDMVDTFRILLYNDSGTIRIPFETEIQIDDVYKTFFETKSLETNAALNLLLQRGFLAHKPEDPAEEAPKEGAKKNVRVKIANLEIRRILHQMLKNYHDEYSKEIALNFQSCGDFFMSLPADLNEPTKLKEDLKRLRKNLECIFARSQCKNEASVCGCMLTILKSYVKYEKGKAQYEVKYSEGKFNHISIDVLGKHINFILNLECKYNCDADGKPLQAKSSLAAAENILTLPLPGKIGPEDKSSSKAGTGKDLKVLESPDIKSFFLMGLSVDRQGTIHILAFPNSTNWENVIQINPEGYVKKRYLNI